MSAGPPVGALEDRPERPSRPVLVELASAILVISGAISLLTTLELVGTLADQGTADAAIVVLSFAIAIGSIVLGILVRFGRAWLVAVNVAAVAGFLELTSGLGAGLLFGSLDVVVVIALFIERPWFTWSPDVPAEREGTER